jgi:hypothetical protein
MSRTHWSEAKEMSEHVHVPEVSQTVVGHGESHQTPYSVTLDEYWRTLARVHNGGPSGASNPATIRYARRVMKATKDTPPCWDGDGNCIDGGSDPEADVRHLDKATVNVLPTGHPDVKPWRANVVIGETLVGQGYGTDGISGCFELADELNADPAKLALVRDMFRE